MSKRRLVPQIMRVMRCPYKLPVGQGDIYDLRKNFSKLRALEEGN
jgi:hypothetical protein